MIISPKNVFFLQKIFTYHFFGCGCQWMTGKYLGGRFSGGWWLHLSSALQTRIRLCSTTIYSPTFYFSFLPQYNFPHFLPLPPSRSPSVPPFLPLPKRSISHSDLDFSCHSLQEFVELSIFPSPSFPSSKFPSSASLTVKNPFSVKYPFLAGCYGGIFSLFKGTVCPMREIWVSIVLGVFELWRLPGLAFTGDGVWAGCRRLCYELWVWLSRGFYESVI